MTRRPPIAPRGRRGANAPAAPARPGRPHRSVPAPGASAPGVGTPSSAATDFERGAAGLTARRAALEILVRVESHRAFADVMLGHRLAAFAPPDRRLLTRLVLGTLASRGRLDYELTRLCSQPLEKLELSVLGALRLGLFQMRHLNRVPVHAAVDTSVSLARETCGRGAGGFVNAVLRRAARGTVAMPDRAADEVGYLAVVYSHPRWMVECFIEWFGVMRAEALMAADNEAAPNVMRLNLARGTREEIVSRMTADGIGIALGEGLPETARLRAPPTSIPIRTAPDCSIRNPRLRNWSRGCCHRRRALPLSIVPRRRAARRPILRRWPARGAEWCRSISTCAGLRRRAIWQGVSAIAISHSRKRTLPPGCRLVRIRRLRAAGCAMYRHGHDAGASGDTDGAWRRATLSGWQKCSARCWRMLPRWFDRAV